VLAELGSHRHLGVHTGMISDGLWRLMAQGAVDHSRKRLDAGLAVTGGICGSAALYAAVHGRTDLVLREPAYTHSLAVIATQPDMFCLNSALEVDLLGQANAETVHGQDGAWRWVGGVGGLPDFSRGALLAPRGQAVLALGSRSAQGVPRIVARLSGPATVAASDADLVVTEHGVARLRDASIGQRVQRMLAIAHPEDRDGLAAQARTLGLL
jgi:acyl-CoA hydrolase